MYLYISVCLAIITIIIVITDITGIHNGSHYALPGKTVHHDTAFSPVHAACLTAGQDKQNKTFPFNI